MKIKLAVLVLLSVALVQAWSNTDGVEAHRVPWTVHPVIFHGNNHDPNPNWEFYVDRRMEMVRAWYRDVLGTYESFQVGESFTIEGDHSWQY